MAWINRRIVGWLVCRLLKEHDWGTPQVYNGMQLLRCRRCGRERLWR